MRIVMVVTNPFKPDPRVYKEAKSLAKYGHEVCIIAWDREGKYPKEEKVEGFRVIRVGPKARYGPLMAVKLPFFYLNVFKIILKLKPDAIHTHDFDTAILGFIFKKLKKIMWVYDVHDLYESFVENGLVKRFILKLDSIFLRTSDIVISVNPTMSSILIERGAKIGTVVILNTIDPFPVEDQKDPNFTVFYGGILSKGRFVKEMTKIVEELGIPLRIAGRGILENFVKKCRNVIFLGYIPHKKAVKELSQAHLTFILYNPKVLNNRIAAPNKLFEAMWVGTPVLIVRGTLPERLSEKFGIPVEYSMDDVKEKLKFLRGNPKIIRKKSKLGKKIFLKSYTWRKMEKMLICIYGGNKQ
ncbi:hypothetical protein E3E22_07240 [Thermococcus sp. MV5]|uniref:glycosyltransferase n=1 Tax=Thermococcus sp. MV5 TaxID=1638272 RepID=UPI00143CBD97|nr:glycosyltransferase [Thermococcus sp. MV5]NJE26413.1 hypothetical protein [Thermococcus sp. MV5]